MELDLRKVSAVAEDGRSLSVAGRMFLRRPEDRIWNTSGGRTGLQWKCCLLCSDRREGGDDWCTGSWV